MIKFNAEKFTDKYNEIVQSEEVAFVTKEGQEDVAVMSAAHYNELMAEISLMNKLWEGIKSGEDIRIDEAFGL